MRAARSRVVANTSPAIPAMPDAGFEQRYALVCQAVAEGIYEWDIERNLLSPSARLMEIFGFEGSGLGAADWNEIVHPEDFPIYRAALRDCFRGVTPRLDCEYRVRHGDGTYRWIEDRALPVRNAAGRAIRLVGAVTDVTARKAAEQALRDNEERYSRVSQAVAEGIYDWNVEENTLFVSPRLMEIFKFAGPGLSSEDWYALVHAADRESYRSALRDCFKGLSSRVACEYRIQVRSGEYRWVEDHGLPVRNAAGRAIRLVGAVSDITERKESERALREALERQTATAEILRVISSSPTDIQPTFDAIAASATQICGAANGVVFRFNDGLIYPVAYHGYTQPEMEAVSSVFPIPPSPRSATARAILTREVVHFLDPAADPELSYARLYQFGTTLSVPMLRDGNPLGAITVTRNKVEPFSEAQIDLLKTFAAQAVIAIENVRLFNELNERTGDLQESLEYQTATSDVLKVISRSTFDLQPVLDTLLKTAARLCDAEMGHIARRDGDVYRVASSIAFSPDWDIAVRKLVFEPGRGSVVGRTLLAREAVQIADLAADREYALPEVITIGNMRTGLGVPLLREAEPIGVIYLARSRVEPFTERQIELVRTFADQAVIAIENARLINETTEALERQTATAEILRVISSSPTDVQPVFEAVVESAMRLSESAFAGLWWFDGELLHLKAHRNLTTEGMEAFRSMWPMPPSPESLIGRAFVQRGVLNLEDAGADTGYAYSAVQSAVGYRSTLLVPLLRSGASVGVVAVWRHDVAPYSDKHVDLLQTFADQAVIAVENVRLFNELSARTGDLQESLEYQTATSDVLQVISRSTFDLQPVLDTLVETAARLCGADMSMVFRRDGELYCLAASFGFPPEYEAFIRGLTARGFRPYRGNITGRTALERRPVHIHDVAADPEFTRREAITIGKMRTALGVPLLREGEPIGVIALSRQRVEPFSERQIELVRTFADQAVIAIENTRLLTETREAFEQQQAMAEVLGVINASPGELNPVFDAILENAHNLCGIATGALSLIEGGVARTMAIRGAPPAYAEAMAQPFRPPPGTPIARLIDGAPFVHIPDMMELARRNPGDTRGQAVAAAGLRTALFMPLRREGDLVGYITAYRREVRPFSDKQIALLENFAAQAVIAIENARLLDELRERTGDLEESLEYQTATSDVLKIISASTFDLQPVLDTLLGAASRLCGDAEGALALWDGEAFQTAATAGLTPEFDAAVRARAFAPGRDTTAGRVALERRVIHIIDVTKEPDYAFAETRVVGEIRTTLGVPLLRRGELVGCIVLMHRRVEPFSERQIELVRTFADQAVIAIENTRLITETREALEQQTATAEVLEVINSSPGELDPVFEAMLERAGRLCEAQTSHLLRYENEAFSRIASLGVSEDFDKILPLNIPVPHIITRDSIPYRMLASRAVVHVHDLHEDESIRAGAPAETMAMATGIRTLLFVPLLKEGDVVGCFVMHRLELRPFSDKQIALLESFAAQAVIAMDNARLLQEIRQTQAELRVTFDNMGDGVAMFDAELRLAAWNMNFQKILDLPDEFVAQCPTLPEYFQYMAARGEYGSGELEAEIRRSVTIADHESRFERTRPDGRVIEVRRNAVPGGGSVLIFSDITERKRAEAEIHAARDAAERALGELKTAQANLIQAEKMASLGQLTAGIAHEIKNPLNFVNNFAGLSVELLDELKAAAAPGLAGLDDDTRAEIDETVEMLTSNLEKIAEHGRRADGIVKSMLEHSRGATGDRREVDLNALVEESLNLAYHGARAQDQNFNITLEREFGAAIAPVELVPQDVTRVFLNLIGNGFYAANKRRTAAGDSKFKPILTVTTRELGDAVEVAVRDNGIGIGPELRDKLFQPFFTTKPTGEGTGLGLSISYDIVTQEHGGTITVDSKLGEFTVFTVRLPRERQAVNPRSQN